MRMSWMYFWSHDVPQAPHYATFTRHATFTQHSRDIHSTWMPSHTQPSAISKRSLSSS